MIYYNGNQFKTEYSQVYSEISQVLEIAEIIKKIKTKRIFLIGSGGAYTKFYSIKNYLSKNYAFPVIIEFPKQFEITYLNTLDPSDLIILGTKTGTTDEILDLGKKLENVANLKIGFIGDPQTPLDKLIDYKITSYMTDVHLIHLWTMVLSLTDYTDLDQFIDECKFLAEEIVNDFDALALPTNQLVEKNLGSKFQMWVTSGNLFGEIRCFCNYMLEEIQWINAQAVHSCEYFHGPLEVVNSDVTLNVVLNRNEFRSMDERVKRFSEKYGDGGFIVDMRLFELKNISPKFMEFIDPYVLNVYFDYLLRIYEHHTHLNASTRKYYRKVEY